MQSNSQQDPSRPVSSGRALRFCSKCWSYKPDTGEPKSRQYRCAECAKLAKRQGGNV